MKVALVHDYIKEYGGAERVLEALHEMYPDAPVYTSVYLPKYLGPHEERFKNWKIKTSWLQYIPFKAKLLSPMRLLSPMAFRSFDFSKYDVVIVSATGAYFPNLIKKKSALQICYCHTPPRYLYGYATAREWTKGVVFRVVGALTNHFLRMVDFNASQNVDQYIANSEEVAGRIKKFYRKEAVVVYPPVDVNSIRQSGGRNSKLQNNCSYFVAGGRLARPKHIDLIIDACIALKIQLKVFGRGFAGYENELRRLAQGKRERVKGEGLIELVGEISDEEKVELMRNAKAYIMAAEDEDFGILPVEAMAQGTPVIAYRSGGVKETVLQNRTGIFFEKLTIDSLKQAIKEFEKTKFSSEECIKRAEEFSKEKFMTKVQKLVESLA